MMSQIPIVNPIDTRKASQSDVSSGCTHLRRQTRKRPQRGGTLEPSSWGTSRRAAAVTEVKLWSRRMFSTPPGHVRAMGESAAGRADWRGHSRPRRRRSGRQNPNQLPDRQPKPAPVVPRKTIGAAGQRARPPEQLGSNVPAAVQADAAPGRDDEGPTCSSKKRAAGGMGT
jgi:hypothetical protein